MDAGTQTSTSYTLNVDPSMPSESVIMTLSDVDGEQLQVLGEKDDEGIPVGVDTLILDDQKGNVDTQY